MSTLQKKKSALVRRDAALAAKRAAQTNSHEWGDQAAVLGVWALACADCGFTLAPAMIRTAARAIAHPGK